MRWPWKSRDSGDLLVVSWCRQSLAYVRASALADGRFAVRAFGVERQDTESLAQFARRLEGRGLQGLHTRVMLRPEQYQWLQIEAPGVAPQEMRSAARYQIRDLLNVHVDDVTLDVMRVGDGQARGTANLFVVAAPNVALAEAMALGATMRWDIPVMDVQETAQRNLQNALERAAGQSGRASAALVLLDASQALLTISANEELFYTRRIDVPPGFLAGNWDTSEVDAAVSELDAYALVEEYVPAHGGDGAAHGTGGLRDDSRSGTAPPDADEEAGQRFLLEVQRSLDVWDRSWSSLPLATVRVHAGARTNELAQWLSQGLGQSVSPLDIAPWFDGFEEGEPAVHAACWPLLGLLMRTESRAL